MVDLEENDDIVECFVHEPGAQACLVASTAGYGFIVPEDEIVAQTRKGKQVLNVAADEEARLCAPVDGDHVATIGENRKMLVFPSPSCPRWAARQGVILQRYKDGGLEDARVFHKADGLTWLDSAGRLFTLPWGELRDWIGMRAQSGRLAPKGFPRSNRFGPAF